MFTPFGFTPMAVTCAPSSWRTSGATLVGRAVRGVDDDAHAVEREVARERLLEEDDVAAARVLELLGPPDAGSGGALAEEAIVGR